MQPLPFVSCVSSERRWEGGNGQVDLLAKHTQNCGRREGGGRASWGLKKEAGNSLSQNFSYRAARRIGYLPCGPRIARGRPNLALPSAARSR